MTRSYGIIAFNISYNPPRVLLIKRRDTYYYIELLMCKWKTIEQAFELVDKLSFDEKCRILNHTIQELWDDLWVDHRLYVYKAKCKEKFKLIHNDIKTYIQRSINKDNQTDYLWEFPKGKPEKKETSIRTAMREFSEETRISIQKSARFFDIQNPIVRNFKGTNDKKYNVYYYIVVFKNMPTAPKYKYLKNRIRPYTISGEVSDIKWFTIENAYDILSPLNKSILTEAYNKIYIPEN